MIFELLNDPMTWWLAGTAILFTFVGRFMGLRTTVDQVVSATIDSLIKDGYLKTRGTGADMEILKWREWHNEQAD